MTNDAPSPPKPINPDSAWEHYDLYEGVRDAISALSAYFRTETHISGVMATDIHTLNNVLGATIEEQVVRTLNAMRMVWDPHEKYGLYSFERQAQTFPDVLLKRSSDGDVLLGIELKGWYLLAKEGEPSFRYQVTPTACAEHDLLVVVPWVLAQVISGSPIVFDPFVESARYAALYRNYHWQHLRDAKTDSGIRTPTGVHPYPAKSDQIADEPLHDRGGNFGRVARSGIMDTYLDETRGRLLCGIQVEHWLRFFKVFREAESSEEIRKRLDALERQIRRDKVDSDDPVLAILDQIERLVGRE